MHSPSLLNQSATAPASPQDLLKRNSTRSKKVSGCRAKNLTYYQQVNAHVLDMPAHGPDTDPVKVELRQRFEQYRKNLIGCACNSLYRKSKSGRECSYITSQTCSHRLCNVCNMIRSRKLRRKWRAFLQDNIFDVPVRKAQLHFFDKNELCDGEDRLLKLNKETGEAKFKDCGISKTGLFTSGSQILQNSDLMHLTLTVPHEGGQWCGLDYYAEQLLKKFNEMRKASWWVKSIFGGEYTVETTQNKDGLHIHIHALLFVDKTITGSRNHLSEMILRRWNALTVDANWSGHSIDMKTLKKKVVPLDAARREGIEKGYAFLINNKGTDKEDRNDLNNLLLDLDNRGSTMIGLKSLYYEVSAAEYHRIGRGFEQNGKYYVYSNSKNLKSTLKGVIECLKYHFEPCAMEDENGLLNMPLLEKVLPNIYRQRLYGKFGGFYGVTALNVMEDPISVDDMLEDAAETANEAYDPATGNPIDPSEYIYVIADAKSISYDSEKPLCYLASAKIKCIVGGDAQISLGAAVSALCYYSFKKKE